MTMRSCLILYDFVVLHKNEDWQGNVIKDCMEFFGGTHSGTLKVFFSSFFSPQFFDQYLVECLSWPECDKWME